MPWPGTQKLDYELSSMPLDFWGIEY